MAQTNNSSPLNIIVYGANAATRTRSIDDIRQIDRSFIITAIDDDEGRAKEILTKAVLADLMVIVCEAGDQSASGNRGLIKMATIAGVPNFLLIVDQNKVADIEQCTLDECRHEFEEYINYLSQEGSNISNSAVLPAATEGHGNTDDADLRKFLSKIIQDSKSSKKPFRMPVKAVSDSSSLSGTAVSGRIGVGDQVVILPSAIRSRIETITCDGQRVNEIEKGQSGELKLAQGAKVEPGDMICNSGNPVEAADQFETTILWLSDEPMMSGRPYALKSTTNTVDATITTLKYLVNVDSFEHVAANQLENEEIGVCNISLSRSLPFENHDSARHTAQFTLLDKESDEIVGMGVIHFALRRASNVHWQHLDVTRQTRAKLKGQKPAILWFTGLSGSGKSAIANIVEKKLTSLERHTYTLDGDNIRHGLNRDLGFTDVDRVENIRRIGEVSKLMADCGLIALVSFISPFRSERQLARELAEDGEFIEIYVDTPLEVAEARDIKGLYKKARAGEIKNFTGIDSPYEAPENPEIRVDTTAHSAEAAAEIILEKLNSLGVITIR